VITGFSPSRPAEDAKPANEVITGFLPEVRLAEQGGKRPPGASEAYRELIELELSRGRNAMGIWRDLVDQHGYSSSYQSVQRFFCARIYPLGKRSSRKHPWGSATTAWRPPAKPGTWPLARLRKCLAASCSGRHRPPLSRRRAANRRGRAAPVPTREQARRAVP
jgi:hypothetical protein